MDFHLQEGFQVEGYSLEVNDQDFRRLFNKHLLGYLLHLFVAVLAEVIGNLLRLDELIEAFLEGLHPLYFH